MASVAHLAAGALCGAVYARKTSTSAPVAMAVGAVIGLSPDLDFFAARLGARGTPLQHRVMTHSLFFAVTAGALLGSLVGPAGRRRVAMFWCAAALMSHGVLDAMTANDPSPALFWPFTRAQIAAPWQPIPGTTFYLDYFKPMAVPIVAVELLWCLPMVVAAVWVLRGGGGDGASAG